MNTVVKPYQRLLHKVDKFLDRLTTYRLVLYFLCVLIAWAAIVSLFNKVPFHWYEIIVSATWLAVICRGTNLALSRYFKVPKNNESDLITALILSLIISPATSLNDFFILTLAGIFAMASKYILVINRWHVFNPAALGALIAGAVFNHYASWWVGTNAITPVVIIGGLLILRKMKRYTMALWFIVLYLLILAFDVYLNQSFGAVGINLRVALISSPLLFLAFIMLTEPLTSPRFKRNYLAYASLVAVLYGYTKLRISPEEALLIGNVFAYVIEPNRRLLLKLVSKTPEAAGVESFVFSGKNGFKFKPGQYMEWTLPDADSDSRGNRRYLTISSSPTEKNLMVTLRIQEPSSSFKESLRSLKSGDTIYAAQLAGSFTLPKSEKQKLAFLAGGVGITPFRSMIKYLIDFKQERDIVLLYSAHTKDEFAFRDLFSEARASGLETEYLVTGSESGRLNKDKITQALPDFGERTFYVSGSYSFVQSAETALKELGVPRQQIITDYFPGYG